MDGITTPWLAEVGLIVWRSWRTQQRPPLPSEILSTFVVFGAFSLIPDDNLQMLLGWGVVIATALNVLPLPGLPKKPGIPATPGNPPTVPPGTPQGPLGPVQPEGPIPKSPRQLA